MNGRDLTIYFGRAYEKKFGQRYPIAWGKHAAIFKNLVAQSDANTVVALIDLYLCRWTDNFATRAGHSIEVFKSQVPALLGRLRAEQEARERSEQHPDLERLSKARSTGTELGKIPKPLRTE